MYDAIIIYLRSRVRLWPESLIGVISIVIVESAFGTGMRWTIGKNNCLPDRLVAFTKIGFGIVEALVRERGSVIPIPGVTAIS